MNFLLDWVISTMVAEERREKRKRRTKQEEEGEGEGIMKEKVAEEEEAKN